MPSTDEEMRKRMKGVRMSASTTSTHSNGHMKPRRTSRPLIAKGPKGARLAAEERRGTIADTLKQTTLLVGKLKLLQKLLARQESAGKTAAATETRVQIDMLKSEISILEMDVSALSSAEDQMVEVKAEE